MRILRSSEEQIHVNPDKALGRRPVRSDVRALMMSAFIKPTAPDPPKKTEFWKRRAKFLTRHFGNLAHGDCTRAKQAIASMRMERIEVKKTPFITDEEIIRVYYEMTQKYYGGGDTGAYETDALNEWRNPEATFKDKQGRPLTIDAYTRLDPFDHLQVRQAIALAGAHGIAVCLNLPWAFAAIDPPNDWDLPQNQPLTGDWEPGSWGGHSMWARDYDEVGIWLVHTWNLVDQRITWRAAATYLDEGHLIIDALDYWRKKKPEVKKFLNLSDIRDAVNAVSSILIK